MCRGILLRIDRLPVRRVHNPGKSIIIIPMPWHNRLIMVLDVILLCILITGILGGDAELYSPDPAVLVRRFTRMDEFDFVNWTVNAFAIKLSQAAIGTPFYFSNPARVQIVHDYLDATGQILWDEYQVNMLYSDPSIPDPEAASSDLRNELKGLYARQHELSPLAEAVLQEQVAAVAADMGLTIGGQPWPPVLFHITPLPYNLVVSPRDKIQQDAVVSLVPDVTVDRQATLENEIDQALDVSSLVVPVGGIGTYPTMVMETTALDWLADTVAHEWIHNWLSFHALGLNYGTTPELRTMNETTASIAGREISLAIFKRYYPDLLSKADIQNIDLAVKPYDPHGLPRKPFDFNHEMHLTRVHVDELLAQGSIEGAEAYMEQRRVLFWEQGCPGCYIRKLNQAYFAFYGAYADIPGGAAGADPVGPAVRLLRERSHSLTEFLRTIASMNSFQDLQDALTR
jgi:hypothetical protein